jgi:tetratricopeptide (TPR) repeat protein
VRALLAPYHAHVRSELERFGGTVEKFIGDAVMAVFGAPVAHEDDPERAVRAALAIRDWASEEQLELRIGVNTGEALVTIGGEPLAAGDVVNTAARLQSAAPSSGILAGDTTYRATRGAIDYDEHDPVQAKGKAERVPVWVAAQARGRVTVERTHGAMLVGRERELALLRDALARARAEGSAQLVTLVGVPGIGKSRLVFELFRHLEQLPELVTWRHGRCLPYGDGVSFWALGEIVKAQAGILDTDAPADVERKLHEAAADDWVESHLRPLVGLSVDTGIGGDRRVEAFAAWRRFLETLAEQRPLVLVAEDVHWADDDLLDFVDHLVDWASGVALLVVCTARPELLERRPTWGGGKPNALTISLSPLSDEDTAQLIGDLLQQAVLPAEQQASLLARAGGNPLYAEQFAHVLRERGAEGDLPIPETVQGIVAARLDLLQPEEKTLLQDAAVLGRTFWAGGLSAMAGGVRAAVEERVHPLERKDFVRRERRSTVAGDTQYTFLHLLVRDVAYGQIPRSERAEKHRLAAEWIESLGRPEDHADLLAHHYLAALELFAAAGAQRPDVLPRAARALREAGDRAFALNAFQVAENFYRRALDLTPPPDAERAGLLLSYARTLLVSGSRDDAFVAEAVDTHLALGDMNGAAEAELVLAALAWQRSEGELANAHLDRATSLLAGAPPSPAKARVLGETTRYSAIAGRDEEALATGLEAIAMADTLGLDAVRAYTLMYVGMAQVSLGDDEGFPNLELSTALLEKLRSPDAARAYNNLGATLMSVGETRRALEVWRLGVATTQLFGDSTMTYWLGYFAGLYTSYLEGDWDQTARITEDALTEHAGYYRFGAHNARARVRLARGELAGALADAEAALELGRSGGDPQALVPGLSYAATTLLAAGRRAEAEAIADELLSHEALRRPVSHYASPWFDFSWTLVDLGRTEDLLAAISRVETRTRWTDAGEAIGRGDYVAAAEIYADVGNLPAEAYTRLRAAQANLSDARLDRAIAFFRRAGATSYLAAAEALVAASA